MADFQFTPPDYSQFAANTGYGYGNWQDQMKDAFSIPSRGAGVFMGNKLPRYGHPAPNMTFPVQFQQLLAQYMQPQGGGQPGGGMGGLLGLIRNQGGPQPTTAPPTGLLRAPR